MESDAVEGASANILHVDEGQALNSTILEYYKKFGRKRDLEQYFSLNTAQGDIKDVSSLFWRRMKSQESSDSGEKSKDSSMEVCRISIKCTNFDVDPSSSQDDNSKTKSDSVSPPIITEEAPLAIDVSRHSDNESVKSDDNNSQRSMDAMLDTSTNKALSPSSSITSQRKLEWDSLADVGYANESDKKTSASSLSTLERLALKQQYTNNDTNQENFMGPPTAHSTPLEENDPKSKPKKLTKTTKIYRKEVDFVEFNVPHSSDINPSQSINVNLTKHISFNVEKNGGVSVDNIRKDVSVSPEKRSVESLATPQANVDKEIQTSLIKTEDKSSNSDIPKIAQLYGQSVPVLINLNTFKKRNRRKKYVTARKKLRSKKKVDANKENLPLHEKSGEQVSEAESFEYMPGHIYNQNQLHKEPSRTSQTAGNKSSLESSGPLTTDSSKESKHSFTTDLENSMKLLRAALNKRYNDSELKQKLIKQVVQRLLKSSYRDDESSTDFLSGLSFSSKKIGLREGNTTTSTSDANTTGEKPKPAKPKKSILRVDKFNSSVIATTSQSTPNLPMVSSSTKPLISNLAKTLTSSNVESDASSKGKTSSDTAFAKTSSEELYLKYLDALRRENAYKRHLRDKEQFLKQKLVCSDTAFNAPPTTARLDVKSQVRLQELMKDLIRNNYDDGSGDASKLEGGFTSNIDIRPARNQRSHSVFTLSSSESNKRSNLKKSEKKDLPKAGHSKEANHYCCCPHHYENKLGVTDSAVQVNIKCNDGSCQRKEDKEAEGSKCAQKTTGCQPITHIVSDDNTGDIKYLCLCNTDVAEIQNTSANLLIYKCSRLNSKGVQSSDVPCPTEKSKKVLRSRDFDCAKDISKPCKGSQTSLQGDTDCYTKPKLTCVHEALRIVQTDISINPKISDPSLSDIKIIDSCECVKLVREQYRQLSKTSIGCEVNIPKEQHDAQVGAGSETSIGTDSTSSGCFANRKIEELKRETRNVEAEVDMLRAVYEGESGDNFTIPIQGTNMTLKVSVGSPRLGAANYGADFNIDKPYARKYNNAVGTDAIQTTENATSLIEECSKGVQSQNDANFSQFNKPRPVNTIFTKDCQPSHKLALHSKTIAGIGDNACSIRNELLDDYFTAQQGSNTYPKSPTPRTGYKDPCPCSENAKCGNVCDANAVCRKKDTSFGPLGTVHYRPCPCPEYSKCGNICSENAECRKQATLPIMKVDSSYGPMGMGLGSSNLCPCPDGSKCGNICRENAECRNKSTSTSNELPYLKVVARSSSPCPCSEPSKCGNVCDDNAECRKNKMVARSTSPCPCPENAKCDNICSENAQCRIKDTKKKNVARSSSPCPCPEDSTCGNICSDKAVCRKEEPETLMSSKPQTMGIPPGNTPCGCPNSATCGGFCGEDSLCRKKDTSCSVPSKNRSTSPSKAKEDPCGCPDSANCDGFCGKDAACRTNNADTNPKPDSEATEEKPRPKSKLTKLRHLNKTVPEKSQTFPLKCDTEENVKPGRSASLPVPCEPIIAVNTATQETNFNPENSGPRDTGFPESDVYINSNDDGNEAGSSTEQPPRSNSNDLIMNVIQDITNRYSKKDLEKSKKKKCFKEIISILNYLLDTEDSTDPEMIEGIKAMIAESCSSDSEHPKIIELKDSSTTHDCAKEIKAVDSCATADTEECKCKGCKTKPSVYGEKKTCVDKGVQLCCRRSKPLRCYADSSDLVTSSELPCTSSDTATCKVLNKIRKECERYHQKRCKCHQVPKKCECSSTTSVSCDQCKRIHYCQCRTHRCRHRPRTVCERPRKKCVAYNLIIQTSESMISEETPVDKSCRPLKNIIVKVPPRKKQSCLDMPFKEMTCKLEKQCCSPRNEGRSHRSRSLPNDSVTSSENCLKTAVFSVRDYLEQNRPDFIQQSGKRQNCLKMISEARANNREAQRELLSMQVQVEPALRALSEVDLRNLAKQVGFDLRQRKEPPKLISEREMKKHSENIYKKLPEVVKKREEAKKENIKKTNLLMANIFKKNLQKKTLRGAVNLSNYSSVIKI